MSTTVNGLKIATTGTDHIAPGPLPAISNTPPLPPGPGPVPAPFLYIARSAVAEETSESLKVAGKPVVVDDSKMRVERPANTPSEPCKPTVGGDVVTRSVYEFASVVGGHMKLQSGDRNVATTGTRVGLNSVEGASVFQLQSAFIEGVDMAAPGFNAAAVAAIVVAVVDPVSVATGHVIDTEEDLVLPGLIPLSFRRLYSSGRAAQRSPLGVGGWTHSLDQWITLTADSLVLRDGEGRDIRSPLPSIGERSFLRGLRIEIRRLGETSFEVYDLQSRLIRRFEPVVSGGASVLRHLRDAWGVRVELVYSASRLVRVVARAGRELRLTHDALERVTRVELWARGGPWRGVDLTYSAEGELESVKGPSGAVTAYSYDGAHRLRSKTVPGGLSFHYRYDEETGRCTHSWGDGGIHEGRIDYDDGASTTTLTGSPEAAIYHRDARGSITCVERADRSAVTRIRYDEDLLVTGISNSPGAEFSFEYDARGNLVRSVGPSGRGTSFEVIDDLPVKRVDAAGNVTEHGYDSRGALVSTLWPNGLRMTMEHDDLGRLIAVRSAGGVHGAFAYDDEDNLVSETGPLGQVRRFAYDALGQIVSVTDALGRTTKLAYDADGRVISTTHPDGTTSRSTFDALGRKTTETDAEGAVTRWVYAGTRAITEIRLPDGTAWTARHDRMERPRQLTNAKGETWEWHYDRAGYVIEERTFDGRSLRYSRSPEGHLTRIDRPDGSWRSFVKSASGQTLAEQSSHGAASFAVDEQDRVTEASVQDGATSIVVGRRYDSLGRLVEEVQDGLPIALRYDDDGRLVERVLNGVHRTRYELDRAGRVSLIEHANHRLRFTYDACHRETRRDFEPAGVSLFTEHDSMDRVTRQLVLGPERPDKSRPVLVERAYSYDRSGRRRSVIDSLRGTINYEHDVMGQLIGVRSAEHEEHYEHDVAGSVTAVRGSRRGLGESWKVGPGNVLLQAGDLDFEYDSMRRRTRRVDREKGAPPRITEYGWDCRDRLREVRLPDGGRVVYSYDAFGRRLRKEFYSASEGQGVTEPTRTVRFLWQASRAVAEIDSERGTRVFVHMPGGYLPLLEEREGVVSMYVCDPMGTPLEIVDGLGVIRWRSSRNVWGEAGSTSRSAGSAPFSLLGQMIDEETGLAYAWNRYFDSTTLRWISPDPLGLDGGRNGASFNGSPVTHVDPEGLHLLCMNGRPADDQAFRSIAALPPNPDKNVIAIHGYPYHVEVVLPDGRIVVMDAKQFAAWVRAQPFFMHGRPVVLVSCYTGRFSNGFAQQLANELGVPVTAPTRAVGVITADGPYAGSVAKTPNGWDAPLGIPADQPAVWPTFWPAGAPPGPAATTGPFPHTSAGAPFAPPCGPIPPPHFNQPPDRPLPGVTPAGAPSRTATAPPASPAGGSGLPFQQPSGAGTTQPMPAVPGSSGAGGTQPMPAVPGASGAGGTQPMPAVPGASGPGGTQPMPAVPDPNASGSGSGSSGP